MKGARGNSLTEFAPAKVNLSLAVKSRRPDGFHELSSLVVFTAIGDELTLISGNGLSLGTKGQFAAAAGDIKTNLVIKAAAALARRVRGLKLGSFSLDKRIPVAAGLGGGSADAAAALRLLATTNGLSLQDAAIADAAAETGSDVPVCLFGGCRLMCGRGERLGPMLDPPPWYVVLVNPGIRLDTARVFKAFAALPSPKRSRDFTAPGEVVSRREWLAAIASCGNDLEEPASSLAPLIGTVKLALLNQGGCLLARMTGSGPTVFGIFEEGKAAHVAARRVATAWPHWWVRETVLATSPDVNLSRSRSPRSDEC
jgi:4-diphosphocytidyl-2-C-methyl-D-erythritol kinase